MGSSRANRGRAGLVLLGLLGAVAAAQASPSGGDDAAGRELYVSPRGVDSASGAKEAPLRTVRQALGRARPGDVIRLQPGEYRENIVLDGAVRAGQPRAPIRLEGEGRVRILPGRERGALVQVRRPHWSLEGLEVDVRGQQRFAVIFEGNTQGSALRDSHLKGGTLGGGVTTANGARGVLIQGNHIHDFHKAGGGDSHGVVVQATSRDIVIRDNHIHHTSGDAVQCLKPDSRGQPPAAGVRIEGNRLHSTGENGVDIKTCRDVVVRDNRMYDFRPSRTSAGEAVVVHYSARGVRIEGNAISQAGRGISVGGVKEGPDPSDILVKDNHIRDISARGDGVGIRVENSRRVRLEGNRIEDTSGYGLMLGLGHAGGPSQDLTVEGNTVRSEKLVRLGRKCPRLRMDRNQYAPRGLFKAEPVETRDFSQWKRLSRVDGGSTQR